MSAEFFVMISYICMLALIVYFGGHKIVLNGLDARGKAIADELAQAAKLRQEAQVLLASFDSKRAEAEAQAAAIVAEAQVQAEQLAKDAAARMEEFVARRTRQAEAKIALAEAQAAAEVRAAAADHAARAAEILLRGEARGAAGSNLITKEIGALKARLN